MDEVGQFIDYLRAERGYSALTLKAYGATLEQLFRYLRAEDEHIDWQHVDSDLLRLWLVSRMESGISAVTVRRECSAVRSFFRYLMLTEAISRDPAYELQVPKAAKPLPAFLRKAQMDQLLDHTAFGNTYVGQRDRTLLLLFYSTGMRVSELVGLNLTDVRLSERQVRVVGKRNKERIIPLTDEIIAALAAYEAVRANQPAVDVDALFLNRRGHRLSVRQVQQLVKEYLSTVSSQEKRTPHVLRHTFATAMIDGGADLEAVRQLLGHESLSTTQIYTHTTFEELRREYEKAHPRDAASATDKKI